MMIDAIRAAKSGDEIRITNKYYPTECDSGTFTNIPESSYYPEYLVINKQLTLTATDLPVILGEYLQNPTPGKLIRPPFKPEDKAIIVNNKKDLLDALVRPGIKIIYIQDNAKINMTGEKNILIPFGVTLASGRGNGLSKGALLYWNAREETAGSTIFKINNSSVRITGIRFKGPTTGVGERLDTKVQMGCFEIVNTYETVEIDHNEFYGWLRAAIDIDKNSLDPSTISKMHVHDNYFHHNLGFEKGITSYTFGYGVVVGAAYALIEKNIFDQNRHAIAGNGSCHSGYEARWNVVLDKNDCCGRPLGIREGSHSFDMHRRGGDNDEGWWPAGEYIMIRENTFLYKDREAFVLRGRPTEGAFVLYNTFVNPPDASIDADQAVNQRNDEGNLVAPTQYNEFNVNHQNELAFGDFDGDGKTDVFWADGRNWWYSRRGSMVWTHLNNEPHTLHELAFGDFDGNGITDVFKTDFGKWWVSFNGTGEWTEIFRASEQRKDLAFGDFDGNGKTDVFFSGLGTWQVVWNGTGAWTTINSSPVPLKDLAFGDFNGDGKTDVFRADTAKKEWQVSWSGAGPWQKINSSGIGLKDLAFGDFNGDKKTDVFRVDFLFKKWKVSESGKGKEKILNNLNTQLFSNLRFCDLDADGKTDVLSIIGTSWFLSSGGTSGMTKVNPDFDGTMGN